MAEVLTGELLDADGVPVDLPGTRVRRIAAEAPEGVALGVTEAQRADPSKTWADGLDAYIRLTTA